MTITISTNYTKSIAGLNYITVKFDNCKFLPGYLVENARPQAVFCFSEIIKGCWLINFYCGDCAEDISTNLKEELMKIENFMNVPQIRSLPSMSLALEKETHIGKSGSVYELLIYKIIL